MHFPTDASMFGQPIALVRDAARRIDSAQWCSAGVLGRDLSISLAEAEALVEAFKTDRRVDVAYGPMPEGHHFECLAEELADPDNLRLYHVTNDGKSLAKAKIGPPLTKAEVDELLQGAMMRIHAAIENENCSHKINRV